MLLGTLIMLTAIILLIAFTEGTEIGRRFSDWSIKKFVDIDLAKEEE